MQHGRLFGTDGMRGRVNSFPMLPEVALRLGLAAGAHFRNGAKRHRVVIGKDTRLSGYIFETALTSGFCAAGMDVYLVGPLPTPAISFLARNMRADAGVVISASHNPFADNGIKFFDSSGFKLPDEVEDVISGMVLSPEQEWPYPAPREVGRAFKIEDSPGRYIVYLKNSVPASFSLDGIKIVLDCANGATYKVAPSVFEELGAKVFRMATEPDGTNINERCGSLHPEHVAKKVVEVGADIGIALDGDGDRIILVDEKGKILDGDQIMAVCAKDLMNREQLPERTLVATVMSNMALETFMKDQGGTLVRTAVGDRYVVECMRKRGASFGGEQSGHLIFMHHSTTGDGILAALQMLRIMLDWGKPLSEISSLLEPYPQSLINIQVRSRVPFEHCQEVQKVLRHVECSLAGKGRVLLRYSGTEPVARVMVEGENRLRVESGAREIAGVIERALGAVM